MTKPEEPPDMWTDYGLFPRSEEPPAELTRLLADFRYCALSDTCVDDLSPYTENARRALVAHFASLESQLERLKQERK